MPTKRTARTKLSPNTKKAKRLWDKASRAYLLITTTEHAGRATTSVTEYDRALATGRRKARTLRRQVESNRDRTDWGDGAAAFNVNRINLLKVLERFINLPREGIGHLQINNIKARAGVVADDCYKLFQWMRRRDERTKK